MTTQPYNQETHALYELFEPFATALSDMRDKATTLLLQKKDESEVYGHLCSAEVLLDHVTSLLANMGQPTTPMPIEIETALRVREHQIRLSMQETSGAVDIPRRIRQIMDRLNQKMEQFFSMIHEHYSASEEQLNWYRAIADGTFNSKAHGVELSPNGWAALQAHLESDEPNRKFEDFSKRVAENKNFKILNLI